MSVPPRLFNRRSYRQHQNRAAHNIAQKDFLFKLASHRLIERCEDMRRDFPVVLDMGCHYGELSHYFAKRNGTIYTIAMDVAEYMLSHANVLRVQADEELLPFQPQSFDAVLSALSLHWVNDLPGCLAQIRQILKAGGMVMANMFGAETLKELKAFLLQEELALYQGAAMRVAPFCDVKTLGALLGRAGFASPIVDTEIITVEYENYLALLHDLRAHGQNSVLIAEQPAIRRKLYDVLAQPRPIKVTFELITVTALCAG